MTYRPKQGLQKVAVFIDRENLTGLDPESLMAAAGEWGQIVIARGYGKFERQHRGGKKVTDRLSMAGIEPVDCTGTNNGHGDLTDLVMIKHILHTLAFRPDIKCFVVCTGDADFVPLILVIKALGREAIVAGRPMATSTRLKDVAHHYWVAPHSGNGRKMHQPASQPESRASGRGTDGSQRELISTTRLPPLKKPDSSRPAEERDEVQVNPVQPIALPR